MTVRRPVDAVVREIAEYVCAPEQVRTVAAVDSARLVLADAIACAFLGAVEPDCLRVARPRFPNRVEAGARVPATPWELDPVQAAHATGCLIRWLDYNDAWLALEWGHPSDNLGGILAVADHLARTARAEGRDSLTVRDVLAALVQAHEIQGVLALGTAYNRSGMDHVINVRVATSAVVARMLGGDRTVVESAVSNAFADGGPLRVYRHAPNVGSRKSWAAGDATSRGVWLAYLALGGEQSYASVLTERTWGFEDALLGGHEIGLPRRLGTYIVENVLLKAGFPAEFHGQSAVEAALALRPKVEDRLEDIASIQIRTHEAAKRIIDKTGPLNNAADRDHCLQYMVAIALLHGMLTSAHYEDEAAADPRVDRLRSRMVVEEEPEYSRAYLDPAERAVPNALRVQFADGAATDWVEVRLPVGHPARRDEARPLVRRKLHDALRRVLDEEPAARAESLLGSADLGDMPVDELMGLLRAPTRTSEDRP
jgi:2-methylcitrate dehydratase